MDSKINKFIEALDTYIDKTAELSNKLEEDINRLDNLIAQWKQSSTESQTTC